jgi:hypothetical protein
MTTAPKPLAAGDNGPISFVADKADAFAAAQAAEFRAQARGARNRARDELALVPDRSHPRLEDMAHLRAALEAAREAVRLDDQANRLSPAQDDQVGDRINDRLLLYTAAAALGRDGEARIAMDTASHLRGLLGQEPVRGAFQRE